MKRQSPAEAMIRLEGVWMRLPSGGRELEILRDVSLEVPRGQSVAVTGPSGSGKSTLLGLIAGLDAPSSGRIHLDETDITAMDEDALARLRRKTLGIVFQAYHLIPTMTAAENVALPLELAGDGASGHRALEWLDAVGLTERASHYPAQLSGGEQQRVALARAFAARPKILLADEPTGNLDTESGRKVVELLFRLHREQKNTLVLVTHDAGLAARAQRILALEDGRIVGDRPAGASA